MTKLDRMKRTFKRMTEALECVEDAMDCLDTGTWVESDMREFGLGAEFNSLRNSLVDARDEFDIILPGMEMDINEREEG